MWRLDLAQRALNSGATAAYVGEDELAAGSWNGPLLQVNQSQKVLEIITSNDSPITSYTRPNLVLIILSMICKLYIILTVPWIWRTEQDINPGPIWRSQQIKELDVNIHLLKSKENQWLRDHLCSVVTKIGGY